MSVSLYFGLPGCGKSTMLAYHASRADRLIERDKVRIAKGKKPLCPYDRIYSNVPLLNINNYTLIQFDWLGKYNISNGLVLIDEATLEADSRDYKSFKRHTKEFFLLHRHANLDIELYTQQWNSVDLKIRVITDRVFYIFKIPILGKFFSHYYRVPYGIIIPDPKKSDSEKLGEIIQGYCKPSFLVRLFTPPLFRPKYYKYFDSWIRPDLPDLPESDASLFSRPDHSASDVATSERSFFTSGGEKHTKA